MMAEKISRPIGKDRLDGDRSFGQVEAILNGISGQETAHELDLMATDINNYYAQLSLSDIINDKAYHSWPISKLNFIKHASVRDLHKRLRMGDLSPSERHKVFDFFSQVDPFAPLIKYLREGPMSKGIDRACAGSLAYLLYEIDNPYQGPGAESELIYNNAQQLWQKQGSARHLPKRVKTNIKTGIDEFVLTSTSWKNAWAYFGAYRAKEFLQVLQDPIYGGKLFEDLARFAEAGKLITPAQLFGFFPLLEQGSMTDLFIGFKQLYDRGGNLWDLTRDNGINYQISSLSRVKEYSQRIAGHELTLLEEWVSEEWRGGIMLSLGGALGIVEIGRGELLDWKGEIVIIDKYPLEESLEHAVVIEDEFSYRDGDPRISRDRLEEIINSRPITYLTAEMPQSAESITGLLQETIKEKSQKPIRVINDQRASALYLSGQARLDQIRAALELLKEGGVYYFSKTFADKLTTDQVMQVDETGLVKWLAMSHTNAFLTQDVPLVNGAFTPLMIPLLVENITRTVPSGLAPQQLARQSTELMAQLQLQAIQMIEDEFTQKFLLIRGYDPGASFDELLVYAFAASQNLPVLIPPQVDAAHREEFLNIVSRLTQLWVLLSKRPELVSDVDFKIRGTYTPFFAAAVSGVNTFLENVRERPQILDEPFAYLHGRFNIIGHPSFHPHASLAYEIVRMRPTNEIFSKLERQVNMSKLSSAFTTAFKKHFKVEREGYVTEAAIYAVCELVGFTLDYSKDYAYASLDSPTQFDFHEVIRQIKLKISSLNLGVDYKFNFLQIEQNRHLSLLIGTIKNVPDQVWRDILNFINPYIDVRGQQMT